MSKSKTLFICKECGYESSGWLGKCPACNNWNSFLEEISRFSNQASKRIFSAGGSDSAKLQKPMPVEISCITCDTGIRISTGMPEVDRVLGGGLVAGSLVLVGGDPGIGKSTLLLQIVKNLSKLMKVLYITGEESASQVKMRADRLGAGSCSAILISETEFESIVDTIEEIKPKVLIIDSIQTMYTNTITSAPGSVSQVRETAGGFLRLAKSTGTTVILIGHVTKEGAIAGPKVLEHMVDTVLGFEGEKHYSYRVLRASKNRFGSTNEIGIFEMHECGLVEIENPSASLLSGRPFDVPGSSVVAGMEGTRPLLIEIQALVCPTGFGVPRRMAAGFDTNRVNMLLAVLEKRAGLLLGNQDAYINVVGGIRLDEPACDLGIVTSIASSFRNRPLDNETVFVGEVGLAGELRAVGSMEKRLMEAMRTGFKKCVLPCVNYENLQKTGFNINIELVPVKDVLELLSF